ncbi:hypothetical protein [Pseudocnuella soli]|uniref:hypothetical protein n=1 Tax=Pseudocnuella soli TaxID=2502779 RepID=UPI00104FE957|nr:hypothetical protein [Pseudocnuella soli]
MISAHELRPGNLILQKLSGKIAMTPCTAAHFAMLDRGEGATLYPVVLKPELLERCGFAENMDYPLRPGAREFRLVLPVIGGADTQLAGYVKSNGECFARAMVNGAAASNNVHQLHQLQNLHFALTGAELELKK